MLYVAAASLLPKKIRLPKGFLWTVCGKNAGGKGSVELVRKGLKKPKKCLVGHFFDVTITSQKWKTVGVIWKKSWKYAGFDGKWHGKLTRKSEKID